MRISDWSSDVCSSDLALLERFGEQAAVGAHGLPLRAMREKTPHHIADGCAGRVRAAEKHRADQAENFFLAKCIVLAGCGEHLRDRVLARAFPPVVDQLADEAVEVHQRFSERSEEHTSELQSLMRISYP